MSEIVTINNKEFTKNDFIRLKNLCRLCLLQSKELDLHSNSYLPEKKWIDILINVTNNCYIENNKEEYPQGICEECSSKLVLFYKFKQKIETSSSILEKYFKNNVLSSEPDINKRNVLEDIITYKEYLEEDFIEEIPITDEEILGNDDEILGNDEENPGNDEEIPGNDEEITGNEEENPVNDEENLENFTFVDDIYDIYNFEEEAVCKKIENLQENNSLTDNENIICYLEITEDKEKLLDNEVNIDSDLELLNYETLDDQSEFNNCVSIADYRTKDIVKNKNIICEICGAKFTRKSSLKQHATVHSFEKKFECNICQKKFTRRGHVDNHMLIHSNIRPHACDSCGRAFTKSGDLSRHKKIHSNVYDFICLICNKEFKRKEYLIAHVNSHYDVKPHKCKYCNKCYQTLSGLLKHKKTMHSYKEIT